MSGDTSGGGSGAAAGEAAVGAAAADDGRAIAVIGIATRFPQADSLTQFRANLLAGRDSVRPMPRERMDACCQDPGVEYPHQGYLDRIDLFDHEYFGLSRREAEVTDPQHRLALQLTREALENAGYAESRMRDSRTAVVFSSPTNGYAPLVREVGTLSMIGNIPAGLPARVSHLFGLTGPCYGVDTGCNGSLVAVHQASRELRDGDADFAVAGGVSVRHVVPPAATVGAFPGIASPTAKCRAFDEGADGAAAGEGGAVLLLTTLERALEEGAFIHAVIRGSAVVHNGRHSATIATPSAKSQAEVVRKAWRNAGADLATAGYVEAHGSGTRLGDAVEVEGLALARGAAADERGRFPGEVLPVGSVKTNVGHLDHAAGVAGLVKAVLSVRHGELYPTLHFTRAAEDVDLDGAGLEVVTSRRAWRDAAGRVRRAGVSSFSLGGVNAHAVVEQPPETPRPGDSGEPQLVGVSARTLEDLVALCGQLSLELRDTTWPLTDLAVTLNEGRDHHRHRIGLVARTGPELALRLAAQLTWWQLEDAPGGRSMGSPPRVVLLLSGDAAGTPAGLGGPLPARLPLPGEHVERVRGQLAAHARLVNAGVSVQGLISSGVSRYAVRHLQNRLTAADTEALRLGDEETLGGPLRPERLRAAVEEQLAAGPVVFVELAARGEISDQLTEHLTGRGDARVLTLGRDATGVLEALGRLYEARLDLDWGALRVHGEGDDGGAGHGRDGGRGGAGGVRPRKVPLPGHPFRGVRCWARELGEVVRFDGTELTARGVGAVEPPSANLARVESSAGRLRPAGEISATELSTLSAIEGRAAAEQAVPELTATPVEKATTAETATPAETAPSAPADAAAESAPVAGTGAGPGAAPEAASDVLPWLRQTLAELLYADHVAPDADYFAIGGNSVIALQLIERVLTRYGAALKLVDVYTHPRVEDLAAAVAERATRAVPGTAGPEGEAGAAAPAAGSHRLPPILPGREPTLSYGQERMWFHHQLDPNTTLYNLPGASRVRGEPDLEALRLAWEDLAHRHQALRSNFAEIDGRPQLVVRPRLGDFFQVTDVSGEPDPEAAARAVVRKETHWVFDVANDPLVRVTIVRIAPGDHLFCWTMHHGVNDGWAPQILMGELMQFYAARCEGRVHRPEPLPVQYSDYAKWQRELMEGSLLDAELDYWREQLHAPPALELPTDRPRAARMDYAGATQGFTVPAELVDRLRSLGGQETATLFMVILTGLNVLLSRWSGQRDIVIGTPTVGRSRPELWGLLGFFNNTIALRSDLSGDASFRDLLRRVRAVVLGGMEHQEIPFDRVVREVAPDRDPSRNPIFDVMYVHQTLPPDFSFGDSTFNPGRPDGAEEETPLFPGLPPGTAKFDLTFVVAERPDVDELEVALEYSTQLFDAETITAMSRALIDLLWAAAEDADVNHRQLPAEPPVREEREAACEGPQQGQGRPDAQDRPDVPGEQEAAGTQHPPNAQDAQGAQNAPGAQNAAPGDQDPPGDDQDGAGAQLAYWQRQLTALKPADLPTDRPRPLHGTHASARHRLRVPQDVAAGLARDGGTRERLLAAIAALLGFRAGADEVVLGLADASPESSSGPLALRIDTAGGPTLDGLAVRVREVLAAATAHAEVPFDEVVRTLRPPRQPGRAPLFDVTYAHHVLPPDLGTAAGVDVRADMGGHDLAWTVLEGPRTGEVSVSVEYRTELFEAATAAAMAEDLVTLLRLGLHEPGVPLDVLWLADTPTTRTAGPGPEPYGR